jgi:hypothetical protein
MFDILDREMPVRHDPGQHVRGADERGDENSGGLVVDLLRLPTCSSRPSRMTPMRSDSASASC